MSVLLIVGQTLLRQPCANCRLVERIGEFSNLIIVDELERQMSPVGCYRMTSKKTAQCSALSFNEATHFS